LTDVVLPLKKHKKDRVQRQRAGAGEEIERDTRATEGAERGSQGVSKKNFKMRSDLVESGKSPHLK